MLAKWPPTATVLIILKAMDQVEIDTTAYAIIIASVAGLVVLFLLLVIGKRVV